MWSWNAWTLKEYVDRRFSDQHDAVQAALAAAEKRLDGMNEFRATLADQGATFARTVEVNLQIKNLESRLEAMTTQVGENRARGSGIREMGGWIFSAVVLIVSVATFFLRH